MRAHALTHLEVVAGPEHLLHLLLRAARARRLRLQPRVFLPQRVQLRARLAARRLLLALHLPQRAQLQRQGGSLAAQRLRGALRRAGAQRARRHVRGSRRRRPQRVDRPAKGGGARTHAHESRA